MTHIVALTALLSLSGCGETGPQGPVRVKTVPVKGKVVVDGAGVELPKRVQIRANPVGATVSEEATSGGIAEPDGSFSLSTYEAGDGLPAGEYKLTFQLVQVNLMRGGVDGDDFNGKYDNPSTSEHTVTISEESTDPIDLGAIELSTK